MAESTTTSLATASTALGLIALLSIPSIHQYVRRIRSTKSQYVDLSDRYEDEDGVATQESEEAYSDFVPRLIVLLGAIIGCLDCLVSAILTTTREALPLLIEQWLQFVTWTILLFQALVIFTTPHCTVRYELGIYGSVCNLLLAIAIPVENFSLYFADAMPKPHNVHISLSVIQFAMALIVLTANVLIPRRPDVYRNEKIVDRQNTSSFLGKITFSWPTALLMFAVKNKSLDYADLHEIDHEMRSKTLRQRFEAAGNTGNIWKSIIYSHRWAFFQQYFLETITCFTNFLPQIALYGILRALESRDAGENAVFTLWVLVIGLGVANSMSLWLESWQFFIVFMKIGVPIYEMLSSVVFGKAIRRKDIKGVGKKKEEQDHANGQVKGDAGPKKADNAKVPSDEDEDGDPQKSRQSTINLVGVDSKRIADFATFSYIIFGSFVKIAVAVAFLVALIGWIPLLVGMIVPVIITPLNIYVTRNYSKTQDDLMKYRDQKMAVVTEALQGIRQIKFSALEKNWYEKILEVRRKEIKTLWRTYILDSVLIMIWIFLPVMLAAASLTAYAIINKQLTASVAFTTISVFESIEVTLAVMPEMITDLLDAIVSARRVQEYLESSEVHQDLRPGDSISFQDATVAWPTDEDEHHDDLFKLHDLAIEFPNEGLSVISGKTGSGKSLLLASILGEADIKAGSVHVPRAPAPEERYDAQATSRDWIIRTAIAFVAQIPWIENATIRDNILFGLPFNERRYKKVLHACALEKDLEMLTDGELTDIGANGINLSGGQKWRVSFARALYSRAGILVLDDIFSAVDAHVGRHLFEEALTGELGQGRTRILVTHHVALCLPKTDYAVLLGDGTVLEAGVTDELKRTGRLKKILSYDVEEQRKQEEETQKQAELAIDDGGGSLQHILSNTTQRSRRRSTALSDAGEEARRLVSNAGGTHGTQPQTVPKKFTEDEHRETGAINLKIYKEYIRSSGGFGYWAFVMSLFGIAIFVYTGRTYWISVWTRSYSTESTLRPGDQQPHSILLVQNVAARFYHAQSSLQTAEIDPKLWYYLGIYIAFSIATVAIGALRYFSIYVAAIRASKLLFERMAYAVLRAPLRWLDTVPLGRILNRFTADFNMLDSRIAMDLAFMLHNAMMVLSVFIAGIIATPLMVIFAVLLLAVSLWYAALYLAGAREVKRLESNAKSPVFEQFGSVLMGIGTIRAFDKSGEYIDKMAAKIDRHCQAYWHLSLFNRWVGFRLNMIGAFFTTVTAALIVSIRSIDASLAGFALSIALGLAESVIWMIRQYSNTQLDMNATERIIEYSNIGIETESGQSAPAAWPTEGRLEVSDLVVGYAADLPPVLKGVSFTVERNQRVGVVGRTGAGKSSLTLALFRFLEPREGKILIDGVDVSKITLFDLRSRLAIIPQDPVLFSGTVRSNLDPFDQHEDHELRDALARVQLIPSAAVHATPSSASPPDTPTTTANHPGTPPPPRTNKNIFTSLSSRISEGGLNLSQGQRQLLCLARAIVSRPKIMVLDEATSAVDMETDALIQRSIREEFQDSTLVVIAHRLSTIADFDRILVLGEGRVVEFGAPRDLMEREGGDEGAGFRGMVRESGERGVLEGIIFGTRRDREGGEEG